MKRILPFFYMLSLLLLQNSLSSQNSNYYWGDGKKVFVKEDPNSMVVFCDEEVEIPNAPIVESVVERSNEDLGIYKIIKTKNHNAKSIVINQAKIKAIKNGLIVNDIDTVFITNYILLKFNNKVAIDDIGAIIDKYSLIHYKTEYNVVKLFVPNIDNVITAANEIYETGMVEWCRPNFIRKNELCYLNKYKQYYIRNTNYYCGFQFKDINVEPAWMITKGCADIRVAVLDDGVEDHHDLEDAYGNSRVLNGYSVPNEPLYGRPNTNAVHGQSCAGIIAASHTDSIRGIAPEVLIVPINLGFDYQDEYEWYTAMNWAWRPDGGNADVLSNSWGPSSGAAGNELYIEAIELAKTYGRGGDFEHGIPGLGAVVVFSSGNNGLNEVSDYAKAAIAVGAIDKNDTPAKNGAGARYTNIGIDQDLVAYGGSLGPNLQYDIRSIDREGTLGHNSRDYYDYFGQTSAACPMVSGAAALILSINPQLTRVEVEDILFKTATDLGPTGWDSTYGYGKVNVYEACRKAVETRVSRFEPGRGYLGSSKTDDNIPIIFAGSPGCGLPPGLYNCDVYKLEAAMPLGSVYIGYGLSRANPNDGKYYSNIVENSTNTHINTYFYYIRTNNIGQTINVWVPYDPDFLECRTFLYYPTSEITYNSVVNPGFSDSLYATDKILLTDGFHAKNGSFFKAAISSTYTDFYCLPNPVNNITLKNAKNELENSITDDSKKTNKNDRKSDGAVVVISPNPNKGNFVLKINGYSNNEGKIEIFSSQGHLLYSSAIVSDRQNVLFTYKKGLYYIKVNIDGKIYSEKMILY